MDIEFGLRLLAVMVMGWGFGMYVVVPYQEHRKNIQFQRRIDELHTWTDEQLQRLYETVLVDPENPEFRSFDSFMQYHKSQSFRAQQQMPDVTVPDGREFAVAAMAHQLTRFITDPDRKMQMAKTGIDTFSA